MTVAAQDAADVPGASVGAVLRVVHEPAVVTDHGAIAADSIHPHFAHAKTRAVLNDLAAIGIDYHDVIRVLEDEAVAKIEASWADVERLTHQILTASPSEESP